MSHEEQESVKTELKQNLDHFQKKLVKIIKAEERLSKQYPINSSRLKKQADARNKATKHVDHILTTLLNMGETFKLKRKKVTVRS